MKLVGSSNRLYKDKTSEIDEKYTISRDEIFLYFDGYDCEMLVNDDLVKGNVHTIQSLILEIEKLLKEKQAAMSERNKKYDYKTLIFTNNIVRAAKAFCVTSDNSELIYANAGKHTKGHILRIVMKDRPFILKNSQPLACNGVEEIEAEGVYKLKEVLKFNCTITGLDIHHLGETIGRNIEKMEGVLLRKNRKDDPSFYFPHLFSVKNMSKAQWEGQLVRNYNLLQCANMAGLLHLDPTETFKIIPGIISFDIKSAYMSCMINLPIFPNDLTVIDIDPAEKILHYSGRYIHTNAYTTAENIIKKLDDFEHRHKWYYLAIDPNYSSEDQTVLQFLHMLQPFRRNLKKTHPDVKLMYVNQDQVVGFLEYDRKFYDEFYSIYMELTFEELLYNLFLMCPDSHIVIMYSKESSTYLPKQFRDQKMQLYRIKEAQDDSQKKNISKLHTELTYGKGLQLHDFQEDSEVFKHVCLETINIAMSLTCCSYTRYRLIHDWAGFTPLYLDSDSIKFKISTADNNLAELITRREELNAINTYYNVQAGYPDSNLGSWNIDGLYNYMMFFKKKCYVGQCDDGTMHAKMSGCDRRAYTKFFDQCTLDDLRKIEAAQLLTIPEGKKVPYLLSNNEFADYEYQEVIYRKQV